MIPRTIHYCWFGRNPLPKRVKRCMESWKKYCPDYEIIRWDEQNFDVNYNCYTKEAYDAGKWAFVSDVARMYIIYHHGGIYLDTDVELIGSLDPFLSDKAFMGVEYNGMVATGLGFGAKKNLQVIREMLDEYSSLPFDESDPVSCPKLTTEFLARYGYSSGKQIQTVRDIVIYPTEYFAPMNWVTGTLHVTCNTVSIHYYLASWATKNWRQKKKLRKICCYVLGEKRGMRFYERCAGLYKRNPAQTETVKEKDQ